MRSDLAKQELHVESLNKCIGELQRHTEEQRLALQDAQYGFVESRREQARLQEELSMKEKFSGILKSEMCRSTQNRIRVVRHGDSSEDIGSQLSKVEIPW